MTEPDVSFTERTFLCLGYRTLSDGTLGVAFAPCDDDGHMAAESERTPMLYDLKGGAFKTVHPGSVYRMQAHTLPADGSVMVRPRTLRLWKSSPDAAKVAELEALSRAAKDSVAYERAHKRLATEDAAFVACLEPIRHAYWKTNAVGRRAIELRVLGILRGEK